MKRRPQSADIHTPKDSARCNALTSALRCAEVNNPESAVFISFKMTNIASGDQEFVNSLIGNTTGKSNAKFIMFYKTYSGLGLLISKAGFGSYLAIGNDGSSSIIKLY